MRMRGPEHTPPLLETNDLKADCTKSASVEFSTVHGLSSARERATTIETALARRGSENVTDLNKAELFRVLDRDGSRSLDFKEFGRLYDVVRAQTKRELQQTTSARQQGNSRLTLHSSTPSGHEHPPSSLYTGRRLRLIIVALVALCSVLLSGNTGLVYALLVATKDMFVVQTPGVCGVSPRSCHHLPPPHRI